MHFTIDSSFLCQVTVSESGNTYLGKSNPTEADLAEYIKGHGNWAYMSSKDHPEFARLREQLGQEGYIKIQRGWWNGDSVLKEFYLNGARFRKGEQFCCGSAIKYTIETKIKNKNRYYDL